MTFAMAATVKFDRGPASTAPALLFLCQLTACSELEVMAVGYIANVD